MNNTYKAVDVIKAAMEKEMAMKDMSNETFDQQMDADSANEVLENDLVDEEIDEAILNDANEELATEDTISSQTADSKPEKSGKSLFKNSKSKELVEKNQKIEELTDRLLRNVAEFDNFRKRSEKEKSAMYDMGVKSIVEKMLPIVDNFERGFGTITEKEKEGAFAQGIELIYKQLITALDDIGVKPIDAVGKEFDPNLHNAVMHGEDENLGENIVSDEFQKGYLYRDMVVRHSMVKVVN